MKFSVRFNIVMSKNFSIEAKNIVEAMGKAREMAKQPSMRKEMNPTQVYFDEIGPIRWMKERKGK